MLKQGIVIKQKFVLIKDSPGGVPVTVVASVNLDKCCFELPALAELSFTSEFKNDKHSAIFFWNNGFVSAEMKLQRFENGAWSDGILLSDNTYGINFAYGFYETIYKEKAQGYLLDWNLTLAIDGEGNYRIKATGTTIAGALVEQYSMDFCLKTYTEARADRTVRIDWWLNGNLGNLLNDSLKRDFGALNWFNSIRLPESKFGNDTSSYERTFVKYQNGKQIWTKDVQIEEYSLRTGRFTNELHRFIKIDILQADDIRITDYNTENAVTHQNKFVIVSGNYEPKWIDGSMFASVEVKFQQAYQNFEHRRC